MASDLSSTSPDPKKPYRQILREEIVEGLRAMERPWAALTLSAFSGGLEIGFSLFLMAVMHTVAAGKLARPVLEMLTANLYAVGFIFVVLGRSELFTEQTTLAVLPVLNRRASLGHLARLWATVYVANLCGAAAFAILTVLTGPKLGVIEPRVFGEIASKVVRPAPEAILLSAVLAGWLMGLLSWLVTAARDTISQIVIVWIVATTIGFCRFHHSIVGSVEVLAGLFAGQEVTAADYGYFLGWTTLGNALGGSLFVALLKYGHAIYQKPSKEENMAEKAARELLNEERDGTAQQGSESERQHGNDGGG